VAQNIEIRLVDRVSAGLGKIQGKLKSLNSGLLGINRVAGLATAALAGIGGGNLIRSIVTTTARFQDLRTALSSVTGSAQSGAQAFDFVSKFSTKTQFGIEELTETFIKLKAAGIEPTEQLLTTFTDTAAITTDQLGSLQAITDLFSRTVSGGLGLEELNRLADRGVPVFKILEEQLGITRLEVSEFGKTTEGAAKIRDALQKGLDELAGGATAARVNNLSTQISNLKIAFGNAQDAVGRQGFALALGEVVTKITDTITNNEELVKSIGLNLTKAFLGAIEIGKFLVLNIELIGKAFLLLIGIKVALFFGNIAIAIARLLIPALATLGTFIYTRVIPALNSLGVAMLNFLPGGIIVRGILAGLAAIGVGFGLLKGKEAVDEIQEKFGDLEKTLKTLGIEGIDELKQGLGDVTKEAERLQNESNKINENLKKAGTSVDEKNEKVKKGVESYNKIITALETELELSKLSKDEREKLKAIKDAEVKLGRALTAEEKNQIESLKERISLEQKRKEAEAALPGLISEAGGAFGAGSAEEKAMQEKVDHLEVLRKTDAANEEKYQKLITQIQKKYQMDRTKFQQEQTNQQFELIKSGRMAELDLENLTSDQIKDLTIKTGRELLSEMAKHNKAAFMLNKALALKDAIISTAQGIGKALALGPIGIPLAAIIGAMGAVQIATIAQQQYTGRARGGMVESDTPYMVGERGPEMFVPKGRGTIISAESLRNMNRGGDVAPVNVTFQIQANDTSGFDELITSRRGLIINLINTALNERGKEGITS